MELLFNCHYDIDFDLSFLYPEKYTPSYSILLNLVWNYYVTELLLPSVPSHVLEVYHKELLSLPWGDLLPDLTNMKSMVQVVIYSVSIPATWAQAKLNWLAVVQFGTQMHVPPHY